MSRLEAGNIGGIPVPHTDIETDQHDRFERYIGEIMHYFPGGNFKSQLPGVESITLSRPNEQGEIKSLSITLFCEPKHYALSLSREGLILGKLPKVLQEKFAKSELFEEILRIAEAISEDFFESVDPSLFRPDEQEGRFDGKVEHVEIDQDSERRSDYIDPRRLVLLRQIPGALFGIMTHEKGLNGRLDGRFVVVTATHTYIDNEMVGRALYILPIDPNLTTLQQNEDSSVWREAGSDARLRVIDGIENILNKRPGELRTMKAIQIIHPPASDPQWEKKFMDSLKESA